MTVRSTKRNLGTLLVESPDASVTSGSQCRRPDLNFSQDFFGIWLQVHNLISSKKPRQENAMKTE